MYKILEDSISYIIDSGFVKHGVTIKSFSYTFPFFPSPFTYYSYLSIGLLCLVEACASLVRVSELAQWNGRAGSEKVRSGCQMDLPELSPSAMAEIVLTCRCDSSLFGHSIKPTRRKASSRPEPSGGCLEELSPDATVVSFLSKRPTILTRADKQEGQRMLT